MMNKQQNISAQPLVNSWEEERNDTGRLSSSLELRAPHLWASSPETTSPESSKNKLLPRVQESYLTKGYFGCSTWPRTIAFILTLVLVIAIAIVLPVVLTSTLSTVTTTTSTTTTTTSTSTTTTTTLTTTTTSTSVTTSTTITTTTTTTVTTTTTSICGVGCAKVPWSSSLSRIAYYKFDSNLNDATGTYAATGINSPPYTTGYSGSAISLDAPSFQRLITSPMDLSNKSFTVQLWFYLTRISTQDNAFFGQQSVSNVGKQSLFLMCRSGRLYMGFYADDTIGSTVLQSNTWYHATFVYDNARRQRLIYLNGVLDGQSATGVGPYLGTSGSMTIGNAKIDGTIGTPYFSGYIDELMIYTRAKTACEISNEGALAAYFPLDGSYTDAGPNSLSMTSSGATFTSGYTNQGVFLAGSTSYLQIAGLVSLGQSNYSYSIAFWVYPIIRGVLAHVSADSAGTFWCTPLINFTPSGAVMTQVYDSANPMTLTGPILSTYTWTHIIQTYSPVNGQRLYINGALYASSSASTIYTASGLPNFLTFGNMLNGPGICLNPSTVSTVFQGRVDEMRVYSGELSSIDACLLAQT